jgi:hypothetical protein
MFIRSIFCVLAMAIFVGLSAVSTDAQATRTWVSGVGDDVNPCSRTAPCKTFAGAISKTATGGEINCLDPGGFGTLTITKSITIDCHGTIGSTLASATTGFLINLADTDRARVVRLRGLNINGAGSVGADVGRVGFGSGINGIVVKTAGKVYIEGVVIDGFTKNGISIENTAGTASVSIHNSSIRNNEGNGVSTSSVSTGANVIVTNSLISGNGTGLSATAGTITFSGTGVTFNKTGIYSLGGTKVMSGPNNIVSGNEKDGSSPARLP